MAFMRVIRKGIQKNRLLFLLLAIVLAVGLIGSMAYLPASDVELNDGSPDGASEAGAGSEAVQQEVAGMLSEIEKYRLILKDDPHNADVLIKMGNSYYNLGNVYIFNDDQVKALEHFQQATNYYVKALNINPENSNVRLDLANAALLSGQKRLAEENYQKAIEQDPKFADARYHYGIFLLQQKKYDQAIEQWEAVLSLKPDDLTEQQVRSLIQLAQQLAQEPETHNKN